MRSMGHGFLHRYGIQLAVVDTEAKRADFVGNKDKRGCSLYRCPLADSSVLHATSFGFSKFSTKLTGSV